MSSALCLFYHRHELGEQHGAAFERKAKLELVFKASPSPAIASQKRRATTLQLERRLARPRSGCIREWEVSRLD